MNTGNWIELVALMVTILGGGAAGTSKLTRIAVAAELLAEKIAAITEAQKATAGQVQDHENRLNKANL